MQQITHVDVTCFNPVGGSRALVDGFQWVLDNSALNNTLTLVERELCAPKSSFLLHWQPLVWPSFCSCRRLNPKGVLLWAILVYLLFVYTA